MRRIGFFKDGFTDTMRDPDGWEGSIPRKKDVIANEASAQFVEIEAEEKDLVVKKDDYQVVINEIGGWRNLENYKSLFRRAWWYMATAVFLAIAYIGMTAWTFEAYNMGSKGYLGAAGYAIIGTILIDALMIFSQPSLTERHHRNLIIICITIAIVLLLAAGFFLSQIRFLEVVLNWKLQAAEEGARAGYSEEFYRKSANILRLAWPLLTFAFDIGIGLCLYFSYVKFSRSRQVIKAARNLEQITERLRQLVGRKERLKALPEDFEAQYRDGAKEALARLRRKNSQERDSFVLLLLVGFVVLVLVAMLAFSSKAFGATPESVVVVALDLTGSTGKAALNGTTAFDLNLDAVDKLIPQLSPGTEMFVVGIREQSLTMPIVLFQAFVSKDPGHFGEFLDRDRARNRKAWEEVRASLEATSKTTDVLGVVSLAAEIFATKGKAEKKLVILSDMKQSSEFDFERVKVVNPKIVEELEKDDLIPSLSGVRVYVYGAAGGGSQKFWQSLRRFWLRFFNRAGAEIKVYSPIWDVGSVFAKEKRDGWLW